MKAGARLRFIHKLEWKNSWQGCQGWKITDLHFLIHRRSGSLFIPWIIIVPPLRHLPHLVIFQAALPALVFNPLNIPPALTCRGLWGVSPRSRWPAVGLPFHRHSGGPVCPNCRCFRHNFPKDVLWGVTSFLWWCEKGFGLCAKLYPKLGKWSAVLMVKGTCPLHHWV